MSDTGLPDLPADHFWRVAPDRYTHFVEVYLMRVYTNWRGRRKTKVVARRVAYADALGIRYAAEKILSKEADRIKEEAVLNRLVGDYPPKRLEGE